jgi:hypothetical protein
MFLICISLGSAVPSCLPCPTRGIGLEAEFAAPDSYDRPKRVVELVHALERLKSESAAAMAAWEAAVKALED